jgi:hypothetical protein
MADQRWTFCRTSPWAPSSHGIPTRTSQLRAITIFFSRAEDLEFIMDHDDVEGAHGQYNTRGGGGKVGGEHGLLLDWIAVVTNFSF